MREPRHPRLFREQVAAEDDAERGTVGLVEIREASDRNIELHRIDALAQFPTGGTAPQNVGDQGDERRVQLLDLLRALEMLGAVQVLVVEQRNEFRIVEIVLPR